uniref:carboxyl transferase domain-containing protein n=1 Tax=Streptomyces broussonetiae TaxID=2686304 RepID=UPI0035D551DD
MAGLVETRTWALVDPSGEVPAAQQAKGELTARERITLLFDMGFFCETEKLRRCRALGFGLDAGKPYTDGAMHAAVPAAAPLALIQNGLGGADMHQPWARYVTSALALLNGQVGILANWPQVPAGGGDIKAPEQAARFVQMCDAFNVPLATLSDGPGFLPGVGLVRRVIIGHGAKRLCVHGEVTVSRTSLIRRKAYGGAYVAMAAESIGADLTFAWRWLGRHPQGPQQVDRNAPQQHAVLLGLGVGERRVWLVCEWVGWLVFGVSAGLWAGACGWVSVVWWEEGWAVLAGGVGCWGGLGWWVVRVGGGSETARLVWC